MNAKEPPSLEEATPALSGMRSSLEARMAMVAALSKSNDPQVQAASQWLAGKTAEEVKKRVSQTIEAGITKAKDSREREAVEASEVPKPMPTRTLEGSLGVRFNLLLGIRRPDGTDEAQG